MTPDLDLTRDALAAMMPTYKTCGQPFVPLGVCSHYRSPVQGRQVTFTKDRTHLLGR